MYVIKILNVSLKKNTILINQPLVKKTKNSQQTVSQYVKNNG